ncbi:MAG: hypothetical protein RJA22_1552 [Verrucomicrobiota bacterium]
MAIDYEAFRETLRAQKKITAKKNAEYLQDEDALINDLSDAETVFSLCWDSNRPGGSGAIWINEFKGFYFCTSSDYDPEGPFESLDDALACEWFHTPTPNPEITCQKLPLNELLAIASSLVSEEGEEVYINSERYVLEEDELVRVKATE